MKLFSVGIVDVACGVDVNIIEPVNLYGCEIQDDVFIGPFVEIQSNSIVGKGTRVQSHTFICSNVRIGTNCFIGHGVKFINDRFTNNLPRGASGKLEYTNVGNNVKIGSGAVLLPVNICDDVIIGAGAVVTRDIEEPGIFVGNPARRR